MRFDRFAEEKREFRRWTTEHREALLATGIPLVAWSSYDHWGYFLDHAHLPYGVDPSGFSVDDLSRDEARALQTLLEKKYADRSEPWILSRLRFLLAE